MYSSSAYITTQAFLVRFFPPTSSLLGDVTFFGAETFSVCNDVFVGEIDPGGDEILSLVDEIAFSGEIFLSFFFFLKLKRCLIPFFGLLNVLSSVVVGPIK